ncbi:MAG: AIR synthase family protein [Clostridiales Family XIII bacterium]|jgi:hydrogenase expression/formation protein HypE|nr:AIR synthase family protein [Clostridiales Family XIII bacterium]
MRLKVGKIENSLLEKIVFKNLPKNENPLILEKPSIGKDCASIDFGQNIAILSTDPITATAEKIGTLAVNITANDIATKGIKPIGIMLTVLLPIDTTDKSLKKIMLDVKKAADKINIAIIGGHTEVTAAVTIPVITTTGIGIRGKDICPVSSPVSIFYNADILVSKYIGLEGTAIIANEKAAELNLPNSDIRKAKNLIDEISVVKEGIIADKIGVMTMHDITEGGVLGAAWEMSKANNIGIKIYEDRIPILAISQKIANHFKIDLLKLISSGSMLILSDKKKTKKIMEECGKENILITKIGESMKNKKVLLINKKGEEKEIEEPKSDEIYKILK